jgi:undecaprenyl-diphosphatase
VTYIQAVYFGILQGATELFPVSSLGHSVLLPWIARWQIDEHDSLFLTFLVLTHTATALVLLGVFWRDWLRIAAGMGVSLHDRVVAEHNPDGKLGWLLVVGTVPAGVLGLLFEEALKSLFAAPRIVSVVLIFNGLMLLGADALRRKKVAPPPASALESDRRLATLTWRQAITIGVLQCVALVPGFSRTGATITGGLLAQLSYEDAARFSFLLATPIIGAASVLKLPELLSTPDAQFLPGPMLVGALAAGCTAYLSVRCLLRYFETKTLWPFGVYCCAVGLAVVASFALL